MSSENCNISEQETQVGHGEIMAANGRVRAVKRLASYLVLLKFIALKLLISKSGKCE